MLGLAAQHSLERTNMNTLVIHAGTGKTGSTSIQKFFYSRSSGGTRDGIKYPDAGNFHHNALEVVVLPEDRWHRAFQILTPPERERLSAEADTLVRLVKDEGRNGSNILVSSEYLCSLGTPAIDRLLERFQQCFSRIVCVLYVREPTALIASSIQQVLKLDHRITKTLLQTYPFRKMISNWEASALSDGIFVRPFVESRNWDVVSDISNLIEGMGISVDDRPKSGPERGSRTNRSMSTEECIVLQRAKMALDVQPNAGQREVNTLINLGVTESAKGLDLSKFKLIPSLRADVGRTHSEDLEWLKENYDISFQSNLTASAPAMPMDTNRSELTLVEEVAEFYPEKLDRLTHRFRRFCSRQALLRSELSA